MFGGRALFSVTQFILIDLKGFRWKPICGDRVENSDSLNPLALLPTRRKGPRDPRTAEQCDELAPSYLTDPHVPSRFEDRHRILPKMTYRGQGGCGHRTQRKNRRRPRD
jgi:hypothetical protein